MLSENGSEILGLDFFRARRFIESQGASIGSFYYKKSDERRFTVLAAEEISPGVYSLTLAGKNPQAYLPSVYQENRHLEQFLWIIQHLQYEHTAILDNLHEYFTPGLAPYGFLQWMADWFGMSQGFEFEEPVMRSILQKGLELYKWRGTSRGLKMFLKLTMGIEPEISETRGWHDLSDQNVIRRHHSSSTQFMRVHFPVRSGHFTPVEKARIAAICKQDKPAQVDFYITYHKSENSQDKGIRIGDSESLFS